MRVRILHFSDCHGTLPAPAPYARFDVVVCSGDLLPDRRISKDDQVRMNLPAWVPAPPEYQEQWVSHNLDEFRALCDGKPLLLPPGNHDMYDPCPMLRQQGIDERNLTGRVEKVGGVGFYGFPWVPISWAPVAWNHELVAADMSRKVEEAAALCNAEAFDVLVAHCPPLGILDESASKQRYGNGPMRRAFDNGVFTRLPKAYLCGHIHHSSGFEEYGSMLVSNAACTVRFFNLEQASKDADRRAASDA